MTFVTFLQKKIIVGELHFRMDQIDTSSIFQSFSLKIKFSLHLRWMTFHSLFLFIPFSIVFSIGTIFLTLLTFLLDLLGDFGGYFPCWCLFQFFSFWFQYQNLLIFWLVAYIRFWLLCGRWSWSIPSDLFSLSDFFCWSFTILICIIIYAWFFVDIFLQALA